MEIIKELKGLKEAISNKIRGIEIRHYAYVGQLGMGKKGIVLGQEHRTEEYGKVEGIPLTPSSEAVEFYSRQFSVLNDEGYRTTVHSQPLNKSRINYIGHVVNHIFEDAPHILTRTGTAIPTSGNDNPVIDPRDFLPKQKLTTPKREITPEQYLGTTM